MQQLDLFLDYYESHPNEDIWYYPSDIKLKIYNDYSYRSLSQAKSQMAVVFDSGKNNGEFKNDQIHVECRTHKNVLASAKER